jgi:hypothetical protein
VFDAVDGRVWGAVALALFGLGVGAAQWLVLRRLIAGAAWWVPASVGATLAAALVENALPRGWGTPVWVVLAVFGAVTGVVLVHLLHADD